jgi:hypothetical protein
VTDGDSRYLSRMRTVAGESTVRSGDTAFARTLLTLLASIVCGVVVAGCSSSSGRSPIRLSTATELRQGQTQSDLCLSLGSPKDLGAGLAPSLDSGLIGQGPIDHGCAFSPSTGAGQITVEFYDPFADSDVAHRTLQPLSTPGAGSLPARLMVHERHAWFEVTWTVGGSVADREAARRWAADIDKRMR